MTINHGELFLSNVVIMARSSRPAFVTNELHSKKPRCVWKKCSCARGCVRLHSCSHLGAFAFISCRMHCVRNERIRVRTAFIQVFAWTITIYFIIIIIMPILKFSKYSLAKILFQLENRSFFSNILPYWTPRVSLTYMYFNDGGSKGVFGSEILA